MVEVNNMAKQYRVYITVRKGEKNFVDVPMGVYEGIQDARKHALRFVNKSAIGGCKVAEVSPSFERYVGYVWQTPYMNKQGEYYLCQHWDIFDKYHRQVRYALNKDGSLGKKME